MLALLPVISSWDCKSSFHLSVPLSDNNVQNPPPSPFGSPVTLFGASWPHAAWWSWSVPLT